MPSMFWYKLTHAQLVGFAANNFVITRFGKYEISIDVLQAAEKKLASIPSVFSYMLIWTNSIFTTYATVTSQA